MKHILFFATRDDLQSVIAGVEDELALKYIRMDDYVVELYEIIEHGADIPNLGVASANSSVACESYLVTERGSPIKIERFTRSDGAPRFSVNQLLNADSVTFTPGGLLDGNIIIQGRIATASDSKAAQRMMRKFASVIKKHFEKVKAFYVGPKAARLFDQGYRLTQATQCPPEYDLAR